MSKTRAATSFSAEEINGLVEALRRLSRTNDPVLTIDGVRSAQDKFVRMQERLDSEPPRLVVVGGEP